MKSIVSSLKYKELLQFLRYESQKTLNSCHSPPGCTLRLTNMNNVKEIHQRQGLMAAVGVRNLNNTKINPTLTKPPHPKPSSRAHFSSRGEWWRGSCLCSVRSLMESFTVRAIRDEEPPFKTEEHATVPVVRGDTGVCRRLKKPSKLSREAE